MIKLLKYAIAATLLLGGTALAAPPDAGKQAVYTLGQAVNIALENNPNLQIMHERIAQAEAQLGEALALFYPQLQARLSYEHTDNPSRAFGMIISQRRLDFNGMDFNHPGGTDNYRPEVTASYTLYNGGQDSQNSKAAELGVAAAALQESAARNQLIEWVTSAFYGVLAAKEAHNIAEHSISAVQSELDQTRKRFNAGTVLKSDVLSLEVQLAEARDTAIQAASAVELAESGLLTLLGIDSSSGLAITDASSWTMPHKKPSFSALLGQAMAERPEIRAANTEVEIAEHRLKAARGAHLPKADAYVSYGSDSKDLDYSTNRDNVTAGLAVSVDIFSGFATSERVKKAESALAIAKLSARQVQLLIEDELKSAYLKLQNALDRLTVTEASVASAEEALRLVNEQRIAGTETVTRYIETEVARDRAQSRAVAARYDALRAEAAVNKALGLWSKEPL
ncbi:MAG: TolC family protein [Methylovulum sp.]|nr:MAG: TolC family protein [Methylovulum sp.]